MAEKIIILCVVMAVTLFAVQFIRRTVKFKKRMHRTTGATLSENEATTTDPLQVHSPQTKYLIRFIRPSRFPFRNGKQVAISREYHRMIETIIHKIGHDHITITDYMDNVLKAHFSKYSEVIIDLYKEKPDGKIF